MSLFALITRFSYCCMLFFLSPYKSLSYSDIEEILFFAVGDKQVDCVLICLVAYRGYEGHTPITTFKKFGCIFITRLLF